MQTIKIYLKESGSVAELVKDFNLYAGSYQNKLLDVYVPTGILYTATSIDNGVKVGGLLIAPNGNQITTKSYYLNFVRNEVVFNEFEQKNIEYAVYERLLPKEFTLFSGDQKIVTNVVAIDNTDEIAIIKQIVTTQTATLVVQESAYLDEEQPIEASELDIISAKTSENSRDIVDLQGRMTTAETNILRNTQEISKNAQEIENIKEQYTQPEEYVGQMVGTILPTQEQLTQFVVDTEGRQPKNADVVIFILQIKGETDKNYKYIYSTSGWNGYEIPAMETAKNGELGLIEGTFNTGLTNDTIVDIVGGQIVNIYVKDNSGSYRNVQEYSNTLKTSIDDIVSGKTKVGSATKAEQDGLGNNIASTYLNKNEGATKNYVQDYALPKQFNDVSYITDSGYSESIPSVSFGATSSVVGSTQLFDITKTAGAKYQISNKNSYDNVVWIGVNRDCVVEFRLTTKIKGQVANVEVNDNISLTAGGVSRITFHDTFDYLNENVLKVEENDIIEQILEVITSTSEEIAFTVYSNSIYPSKFYLNTQSMVVTVVEATGVLGINSEEMQNFIKFGGIAQGQLAICNSTTDENYSEGSIYRFDITDDGNVWIELSSGGVILGVVAPTETTEASVGQFYLDITNRVLYQCVGLDSEISAEGGNSELMYIWQVVGAGGGLSLINVNDTITTSDLKEVVNLTDEQYSELAENGSIVVDGKTLTYNDNTIYVTPDVSKPNTLTFSGTNVLTSNETFNSHVHVMVEFETDSIHAGFDCVLHPYDEAVCFVTYNVLVNGSPNFGTAYLDENGHVVINVPNGLTFTNVHGKYVVYGG